jgi:hypothetical protein
MNKRISVTDYCLHCQDVKVLIRYEHPGVIQWVCSTCGAIVDSDFDNEYDEEDYYDGEEDE